jgi:tetraacyldisaccharide 4'-kinase
MLTRGWRAYALLDVSLLYRGAMALRRKLYASRVLKQHKLDVPVVVVGSIFVGGTGKTPLTIWLVEQLRSRGYTPGVISRGYGRATGEVLQVQPDSSPEMAGDEPLLIARQTQAPVFVASRRVDAARALLSAAPHVNIVICDDGLQHLALARDVEIAVIDARGFGNGLCLPAGPLRDPVARLATVDAIVSRDAPALPELKNAFPMRLAVDRLEHAANGEMLSPTDFSARHPRVMMAAGIGHPQNFFTALNAAGIQGESLALPDHFDFASNPFPVDAELAIVVTQKDALKTAHLNDARIWIAHATVSVDYALIDLIQRKAGGPKTA